MQVEERKRIIKDIISEILEIEQEDLTETSKFKERHGADSLRAIEILASLEKTFDLEIPQDELANMVNLKEVYEVTKKYAKWSE